MPESVFAQSRLLFQHTRRLCPTTGQVLPGQTARTPDHQTTLYFLAKLRINGAPCVLACTCLCVLACVRV